MTELYPIVSDHLVAPADFSFAAGALADAGVDMLQLRVKSLDDRACADLLKAVSDQLASWRGALIVNDRADLAHLLDRHARARGHAHQVGVHLGQTDLPPAEARALLGPQAPIGYSTHSLAQLRAALDEPVTHVAFGPIFATASKADPDPVVGPGLLAQAVAIAWVHSPPRPVIAIGGIDESNLQAVKATGVDAVAVIGAVLGGGKLTIGARARRLVEALRSDR